MSNPNSKVPIPKGMTVRQESYPGGNLRYTCNYCGHSCGWHPMYINHGNLYCANLNLLAIIDEGRDIVEDSRTIIEEHGTYDTCDAD